MISSGGDLKQGLISLATAGAFAAFGAATQTGKALADIGKVGKAIGHGVIGGVSSVAQGGSFKSGFLSAALTKGASEYAGGLFASGEDPIGIGGLTQQRDLTTLELARNASIAAVIGGTGSVLGGGKFQNGAITGAFSRLYNADDAFGLRKNGGVGEINRVPPGTTRDPVQRFFIGCLVHSMYRSALVVLAKYQ